jgi:hypothetical protein
MTLEEAIAEVTRSAQTASFPELTPQQVLDLVTKNQRATVWTAETAYKIGDKVQPLSPNGHFYKCVEIGFSAATEPVWTRRYADTVRDGVTLVWEECGEDLDGNLYNTRNAIHDAWMLKASMSAKDFDVSIDQQKWNRSQIYEHCLEMARAYSPFD